ncbi:hypothetical protein VTL71DRAFT_5638 [Oculimacula yallundae]|uniref:Uncharacterized protein n=1 Tax=Oculimacula yallundae TaxID=86028 RepID=A0ABR4C442_9HELO
MSTDQRSRPIP